MDPLGDVRSTCEYVVGAASHVSICHEAIAAEVERLTASSTEDLSRVTKPEYDTNLHFTDGGDMTVQYLMVVDALNFCFWPEPGLEYEHLAGGLKRALEADPAVLQASSLAVITGPQVRDLVGWKSPLPAEEERARLLREVGVELARAFDGSAANLVRAAEGSAQALVRLITAHFPGFRDHTVYGGRQVFFYKRAQILVGDIWGAFRGAGLGAFHDIDRLTMFADYRVPVVLRELKILEYQKDLAQLVDCRQEIASGSQAEVEIRACTVIAVEQLRTALQTKLDGQGSDIKLTSVAIDWMLWEIGEANIDKMKPHHRTSTIFY